MEHYDAIKEASDNKVDTAIGLILNTSVVIVHNIVTKKSIIVVLVMIAIILKHNNNNNFITIIANCSSGHSCSCTLWLDYIKTFDIGF